MIAIMAKGTLAHDQRGREPSTTSSPIVADIVDYILSSIHAGEMRPGDRISDVKLSLELGVSRTPIREALLRLRELGVVEASAKLFTRVAKVSPAQTADAYTVWLALFWAVLEETIGAASHDVLDAMEADRNDFEEGCAVGDAFGTATANFLLFSRLHAESHNPMLRRSIASVIYVLRLGTLNLPQGLDLAALGRAQQLLIDAVRDHDLSHARESHTILRTFH